MIKEGLTIREAAREWVQTMDAIPQGILTKLQEHSGYTELNEITPPSVDDRVYIYSGEYDGEYGYITSHVKNDDGDMVYVIRLDDGDNQEVELTEDDFEIERDDDLPMWGTMWSFSDGCDNWWLSDDDGLQVMADCGFRIYEQDDLEYVFGIDGAGYDFYESYWVPLYRARGLQWHDSKTEEG